MKIALIGAGKTGSKVAELHEKTVIFNTANPPTVSQLQKCDVVISFLPGDIFRKLIPLLIEAEVPVVTGSTGFDWPKEIQRDLKSKNLKWINAHNFSLGMNLVKAMIQTIGKADQLFKNPDYKIHDIHHEHKVDSPSGTALSWQEWLGHEAKITAERTGDVIGYHHLELDTPTETIKITHNAKDRAIFASGALWSANQLLNNSKIPDGLNHFSDIVKQQLNI